MTSVKIKPVQPKHHTISIATLSNAPAHYQSDLVTVAGSIVSIDVNSTDYTILLAPTTTEAKDSAASSSAVVRCCIRRTTIENVEMHNSSIPISTVGNAHSSGPKVEPVHPVTGDTFYVTGRIRLNAAQQNQRQLKANVLEAKKSTGAEEPTFMIIAERGGKVNDPKFMQFYSALVLRSENKRNNTNNNNNNNKLYKPTSNVAIDENTIIKEIIKYYRENVNTEGHSRAFLVDLIVTKFNGVIDNAAVEDAISRMDGDNVLVGTGTDDNMQINISLET